MNEIPLLAIKKLAKELGAQRISDDAAKELKTLLEYHLKEIGEKASQIAIHRGAKTVTQADLRIANIK